VNLRQLEAFRATMRSGSITGASKVMNISQPSVSRLITDLERAVGFRLFLRSGRGLVPTLEANTFYRGIESMFMGLDRLQDLALSIKTTSGGVVSVAAIQSVAMIELPRAVNQIYQRNPEIHFMIHTRNTPGILDAVRTHQVDLGVVGRHPPYEGVEVLYQTVSPYVCLMPEDHPLADAFGPLDLNELVETQTFVTFGGVYPDEMMAMDAELSAKLRATSRLSAANMPVATALVRETGALALADPFSAEHALRMGGVTFRKIQQELKYHIAVIASGPERLNRHALEFAEILAAQVTERVNRVKAYR